MPRIADRLPAELAAHSVQCPECGCSIDVSHALADSIEQRIQEQYRQEATARARAFEMREAEIAARELAVNETLAARLKVERAEDAKKAAAQRAEVEEQLRAQIQSEHSLHDRDLRAQVESLTKRARESENRELELRKRERELAEKSERIKLDAARELEAQSAVIATAARKKALQEAELKQTELVTLNSSLREQIADLKRRSEQGSVQLQGEVLERTLESQLKQAFPFDLIQSVPKGQHGGDLLHTVRDEQGRACGVILWEFKNTRNWNNDWLPKLRDDQRSARADVAALLTTSLPRDVTTFECVEHVWVTSHACLLPLTSLLRTMLLQVASMRDSQAQRSSKIEELYDYLCGPQFKSRLEGAIEPLARMHEDLEKEKRAMQRQWAKREKQIDRAMQSLDFACGDLQGIAGDRVARIERFELPLLGANDE
ncbi:MAG: DUF2130 domain-containing protein [Phycisphaerales bacterium]